MSFSGQNHWFKVLLFFIKNCSFPVSVNCDWKPDIKPLNFMIKYTKLKKNVMCLKKNIYVR